MHPLLARRIDALRRWYRRWRRAEPIRDVGALRAFLRSRASHVAQMTLYGYLRTRAGTRFPELFENDAFVASMNIAKWHVWLACLSDLAVHAGAMLRRTSGAPAEEVGALMRRLVDEVLQETGTPGEAGPEFGAHAQRVRARLALCEWVVPDGEAAFAESPDALVYWAPIVDDLKALDAEIVRNSVRFRWHEVRRDLSHNLDPVAVLSSAAQ
ncbi:MAG: esterase [Candidatus Acidiferrales bacterium]